MEERNRLFASSLSSTLLTNLRMFSRHSLSQTRCVRCARPRIFEIKERQAQIRLEDGSCSCQRRGPALRLENDSLRFDGSSLNSPYLATLLAVRSVRILIMSLAARRRNIDASFVTRRRPGSACETKSSLSSSQRRRNPLVEGATASVRY